LALWLILIKRVLRVTWGPENGENQTKKASYSIGNCIKNHIALNFLLAQEYLGTYGWTSAGQLWTDITVVIATGLAALLPAVCSNGWSFVAGATSKLIMITKLEKLLSS
jgi:hypothetical protein